VKKEGEGRMETIQAYANQSICFGCKSAVTFKLSLQ